MQEKGECCRDAGAGAGALQQEDAGTFRKEAEDLRHFLETP